MSRIDDLIAELCPGGVEYKALGEIGSLYTGLSGKSKADFTDGNARFASYVNIFGNAALDLTPDDRVRIAAGERQNQIHAGDVLFTASSESADECGMSSAVLAEPPEPLYVNSFCFGFRPADGALLPGFARHLFRSSEVRRQINRTASGVTRFNVSKDRFSRV